MFASAHELALWLADYHLVSSVLLALMLAALMVVGQPARRMALDKATLAALAGVAVLWRCRAGRFCIY